jgi:hypothetical protein
LNRSPLRALIFSIRPAIWLDRVDYQKCEDDQRVQEILDMLPCFNSAFRPRLCIKHVELSLYIDVRITTLID